LYQEKLLQRRGEENSIPGNFVRRKQEARLRGECSHGEGQTKLGEERKEYLRL